jgi:hypothetical protein
VTAAKSASEDLLCELKALFGVCDFSETEYVKTTADRLGRLARSDCK